MSDQESSFLDMVSSEERRRSRVDTHDGLLRPSASKRRKLDSTFEDEDSRHSGACTPRELSHDDYTVGWICALPIELAAARSLLDTKDEELLVDRNDSNTYTLGSIHGHNVVIACLPSGQYGTNNAATVANNMHRSFPNLRTRLLVGIGGGIPGKIDIRLGDVVVSEKVVQYDFGKTGAEGFRPTADPSKPPQDLLTAVAKLRADQALELRPSFYEELQRHPIVLAQGLPGPLEDVLFDANYDHVTQQTDNCDSCDRARLVIRSHRTSPGPHIHYGCIASGNLVMKDGKTRDQLRQVHDALCFEMEAAGVMDTLPCLVVRGICDYSDSHKNKIWQSYAAAAAAVYARKLLKVIPISSVPGMQFFSDENDRWAQLIESLRFEHIDVRRSEIKTVHAKTCRWLLSDPDYTDWLDPQKSVDHQGLLWIKGKPGAGKSTVMNFAYSQATKSKTNIVVSFFFNARGDILERSTTGLYRSLLFQLLNANAVKHKRHTTIIGQKGHAAWHLTALQDMLESVIGMFEPDQPLLFFVDALDECPEDQVREMLEHFAHLGREAVSNGRRLNICLSSRHYPHIDIKTGRKLTLELQKGHEADIATYIQGKLNIGGSKGFDDIKSRLLRKASGVFMWVVLVVDILNEEYNQGRIFAVRKRLDEIPTRLSDLFKEILHKNQQNVQELRLCIQWIFFAKRPLKLEEYYFAVVAGLSPDDLSEWDEEEVPKEMMSNFLTSSSRGLAEITKGKSPTIQFIHESVREFFLKDGLSELWPDPAPDILSSSHSQLQQCCYVYMTLDLSDHLPSNAMAPKASSKEARDLRSRVSKRFPFLEYATHYVLYHTNAATEISQESFLRDFPLGLWVQRQNLFELYGIRRYTPTASLLYILADNNLARLIKTALHLDPTTDIQGERYQYPLFAALANGHQDAARAILDSGQSHPPDDISSCLEFRGNSKARKGQTPLSWAAEKGHFPIVRSLLGKGADTSVRDNNGKTPLLLAAENGHSDVVKLLLEDRADAHIADNNGWTPLAWAADNGHESAVKLLLESGVDVDGHDSNGWTPLSWAAGNGHESVVKLLVENGVNVDKRDKNGWTPLAWAAGNGHESLTKLLLEKGANVDTPDKNGRTTLSWASQCGYTGIVNLLLEKGANADMKDGHDWTPLSWAAENGHEPVVRLLLEKSANANAKDCNGRTPLSWAAENGHEPVIRLLLEKGATAEVADSEGRTARSFALENGHEIAARLLQANQTSWLQPHISTMTP